MAEIKIIMQQSKGNACKYAKMRRIIEGMQHGEALKNK